MRLSPSTAGNIFAWAVLVVLGGVAVAITLLLGAVGLIILGLLTLLICSQLSLNQVTPTWSIAAFRSQLQAQGTPQEREAAAEERRTALAPLRFYRWCGALLVAAGMAALAWQRWGQ